MRCSITRLDANTPNPPDSSSSRAVDSVAEMSGSVVFPVASDPVATVIVIGWGRAPFLLSCLRALSVHQSAVAFETLVALNEPAPELLAALASEVVGVRVVSSGENLGFGGVYNFASETARGEYLVFLNDDTEVLDGWLDELVTVAERRGAGAVGSTLLGTDGTIQEAGSIIWQDGWTWTVGRDLPADSSRFDYERLVDYASASSLLVRRSTFERLGGFDGRYFPAYFEDADLCLRIAAAGEKVWYSPRSRVVHLESASTSTRLRRFLMERNHAVFCTRWAGVLADLEPRVPGNDPAVDRAVWRAMGRPIRVLLIDDRAPDPSVGSGFPRMAQIIAALEDDEALQVSLYATVLDGARDHDALCRLGVGVIDEPLETHLQRVGHPYGCVVISRPHNYEHLAPLVRRMSEVPIIYDAEALYSLRIARQASLMTDAESRVALEEAAATMQAVEVSIAVDADCSVCLSSDEAQFFTEHGSGGHVEVLPPLLEGIRFSEAVFADRADLGFVAGWLGGGESPNADALRWFVSEVLPLLRAEVPGARLLVSGADPPESVMALSGDAVVFLGRVEPLAQLYERVRVIVSPMLYGAGVKNKTVEALQYGVPTVATTIGAEGIALEDPEALLVSDDPLTTAKWLTELMSDEVIWRRQRDRVRAAATVWAKTADRTRWATIVRALARPSPDPPGGGPGRVHVLVASSSEGDESDADSAPPPAGAGVLDANSRIRAEYVAHLETELDRADEALRCEVARRKEAEQQAASLGHLVQQIRAQPSYRLAQVAARFVRRSGPLLWVARAIRRRRSAPRGGRRLSDGAVRR